MADLLLDLATFLQQEQIVAGDGVDLFRDFMPDDPDHIVSLYEYGGSNALTTMRRVQVSVRSKKNDPDTARLKAWEIFHVFNLPGGLILDMRDAIPPGTRWAVVAVLQPPSKISVDTLNRVTYAFNISTVTSGD